MVRCEKCYKVGASGLCFSSCFQTLSRTLLLADEDKTFKHCGRCKAAGRVAAYCSVCVVASLSAVYVRLTLLSSEATVNGKTGRKGGRGRISRRAARVTPISRQPPSFPKSDPASTAVSASPLPLLFPVNISSTPTPFSLLRSQQAIHYTHHLLLPLPLPELDALLGG
jgi:hypothetical protein